MMIIVIIITLFDIIIISSVNVGVKEATRKTCNSKKRIKNVRLLFVALFFCLRKANSKTYAAIINRQTINLPSSFFYRPRIPNTM